MTGSVVNAVFNNAVVVINQNVKIFRLHLATKLTLG